MAGEILPYTLIICDRKIMNFHNYPILIVYPVLSQIYSNSDELQKKGLLQMEPFERVREYLERPFQNIFTTFHRKTDFGDGSPCQPVSDAMNHLSLALQHSSAGPKVNKFLLDVHFPIWSVTH